MTYIIINQSHCRDSFEIQDLVTFLENQAAYFDRILISRDILNKLWQSRAKNLISVVLFTHDFGAERKPGPYKQLFPLSACLSISLSLLANGDSTLILAMTQWPLFSSVFSPLSSFPLRCYLFSQKECLDQKTYVAKVAQNAQNLK